MGEQGWWGREAPCTDTLIVPHSQHTLTGLPTPEVRAEAPKGDFDPSCWLTLDEPLPPVCQGPVITSALLTCLPDRHDQPRRAHENTSRDLHHLQKERFLIIILIADIIHLEKLSLLSQSNTSSSSLPQDPLTQQPRGAPFAYSIKATFYALEVSPAYAHFLILSPLHHNLSGLSRVPLPECLPAWVLWSALPQGYLLFSSGLQDQTVVPTLA